MVAQYVEEPCRSALNRLSNMAFKWSLNPYMGCVHRCTFCYVRGFERRADRPADDRYGRAIRVKTNVAEVLRRELARPSILQTASRAAEVDVTFSVPTIDPEIWRRTEPGTAPPRQRLRALRALVDAGIDAGVGMAPILPGLTDRPEGLRAVVHAAREAGATRLWCNLLYLPPGTREHFLEHLARDWPQEAERYARLYRRPYLDRAVSEPIKRQVAALARAAGIADRRVEPCEPAPAPEQLPLAI